VQDDLQLALALTFWEVWLYAFYLAVQEHRNR
jgi:hypothetical protein